MRFLFRKEHLPWGMAGMRAALGPILIAGAACNWSGVALASLVLSALLSDIFDGVLARRWKCDTAGVRLFDSMADTFFYLCVAIALWIGQPQLCNSNAVLICALFAAEAARFVFDFAKFGKPSSYHSWLAKTWGLLMAIAVTAAFASHSAAPLFRASLIVGILCNAEGLAMSIVLPMWRRDVRNLSQAFRIRRETLAAAAPVGVEYRRFAKTALLLLLALLGVATAQGQKDWPALYVGGTTPVANGIAGGLDTSLPDQVVFRPAAGASGAIEIPWTDLQSTRNWSQVSHHLGVLPAIGVGLVHHRNRSFFVAVSWVDSRSHVIQEGVFQVHEKDVQPLVDILQSRANRRGCPRCAY